MPELQFDGRRRVVIEGVPPLVDDGLFPAKRVVGDVVQVEADIFADGHDLLSAVMLHRHASEEMTRDARWCRSSTTAGARSSPSSGSAFTIFTIEAWIDHFLTWHRDLKKRVDASVRISTCSCASASEMIRAAATRAKARDRKRLDAIRQHARRRRRAEDKVHDLCERRAARADVAQRANGSSPRAMPIELVIEVDRKTRRLQHVVRAVPARRRTERCAMSRAQLPRIAKMGFDVLYLPPIHPIGTTFRKGQATTRELPRRAMSAVPWAIGGTKAGTKRFIRDLGTLDDFQRLVAAARERGIELALDIAFQARPIIRMSTEHRRVVSEASRRHDSIRRESAEEVSGHLSVPLRERGWRDLWNELCDVFRFWIDKGVRIFRVDNPHTKPLPFWHWVHPHGQEAPSRRDFPGRGVYAAEDHVLAGEGRILAVVHLLRVAQYEVRADRVLQRDHEAAGQRLLPAERLAEHARHPHRVSAVRRPPGIRDPADARGDAVVRTTASTGRRSSAWCSDRARAGERGVSRLGKIRDQALGRRRTTT